MASKRSDSSEVGLNSAVSVQSNGAKLQVITGGYAGLTLTDVELASGLIRMLRRRRQAIAKKPEFQGAESYAALVKAVARTMACEDLGLRPGAMNSGARLEAMKGRAREHEARFLS
jgi:hypothetical protein